jgi:hypothetical protein
MHSVGFALALSACPTYTPVHDGAPRDTHELHGRRCGRLPCAVMSPQDAPRPACAPTRATRRVSCAGHGARRLVSAAAAHPLSARPFPRHLEHLLVHVTLQTSQALHRTCRPAAVDPPIAPATTRVRRGTNLATERSNREWSERSWRTLRRWSDNEGYIRVRDVWQSGGVPPRLSRDSRTAAIRCASLRVRTAVHDVLGARAVPRSRRVGDGGSGLTPGSGHRAGPPRLVCTWALPTVVDRDAPPKCARVPARR